MLFVASWPLSQMCLCVQALSIIPLLPGEHVCELEPGTELLAACFSNSKELYEKERGSGGWLGAHVHPSPAKEATIKEALQR